MRVEVLMARAPIGHKRVGDIIEAMPPGLAGDLIRRGIVREAGMASPVDRAVRAGQYVRKGRR